MAKTSSAYDEKYSVVMSEFSKGNLESSDGKKVTDEEQAHAIAHSEARRHEQSQKKQTSKDASHQSESHMVKCPKCGEQFNPKEEEKS
jgi:hypothetical protein